MVEGKNRNSTHAFRKWLYLEETEKVGTLVYDFL